MLLHLTLRILGDGLDLVAHPALDVAGRSVLAGRG